MCVIGPGEEWVAAVAGQRSRIPSSMIVMVRRVVIPLLEYLDGAGVTQRLPDGRRLVMEA